ncbi:MAG: hypothetical protein ACREL9_08225 [Gemmatimonadales bacterium]
MMHCTMDDLLALRDGEGSVWARQHLADCAPCRAELDAVYQRVAALKALPALRPARDRWPAVRALVRERRRGRRRTWAAWGSLAAAAAVAGLVVLGPFGDTDLYADDLARAKEQSATLETQLERYDPDGRVMSGREAALAALLEDRIAVIDGQLVLLGPAEARPHEADLVKLWQERVDLMRQLVTVRATRAAYVGL